MLGYKLLYLASLITFTFGALTFSVLALFYWRERRLRPQPDGGSVLPAFTVVCAAAFLINIARQVAAALSEDSAWVTALTLALGVVTGFVAPLLFHLVYAEERGDLPKPRLWRWVLAGFYALSGIAAVVRGLEGAELVSTGWGEQLDSLPAVMLGAAGALGLAVQTLSRRLPKPARRHQATRRRQPILLRTLLCLMVVCAAVNVAWPATLASLLPDYLVLGFFCVTLYYQERLVFFDLLIKRGAFFLLALVGLTLLFALGTRVFERLPGDWSRPWICALLLLPFWLAAPWVYHRLELAIDRRWLRRRYSPADAERQFVHAVQSAATDVDLQRRASESLNDIFQARAEVRFTPEGQPGDGGGLAAELSQNGTPSGWVALDERPNSIPFMSDDRRLLQSLARTLGVVLENVRFRQQRREQEEREQQLRWLASRAELKALRAQINPHFLFNALNAIAGLIPGQPELADETVEQLAEVFRYTLRKSEKEWVRLDEEVEFVTAYLRVEKARFGERLETDFHVDSAAGAVPIPAMTIQPLIENAIKHGVSAVEGRGRVGLRAALEGQCLRVEVTDNGPGFPPDTPLGHGLRNISERLKGYYGESAQLQWECGPRGTKVTLRIPCAF
ncbi:membrane hypothetical protein [Candidatus Sulfopaludibacter sp. SbA4]|nr:membrane hypothetical protein [Candidatus Sulfopaludibacter sp. SbA4]